MSDMQPVGGERPDAKGGVIFSLRDNQVWVSWHGWPEVVRLGPAAEVAAMMADFLRQGEVAQRLLGAAVTSNP